MAKKTWKDFPENYFKILERFRDTGDVELIETDYSQAVYLRHDLHRFFKSVRLAAEEGDPYANRLCEIVQEVVLVLDPPHATRETPTKLMFRQNALAKMIIKNNPPRRDVS